MGLFKYLLAHRCLPYIFALTDDLSWLGIHARRQHLSCDLVGLHSMKRPGLVQLHQRHFEVVQYHVKFHTEDSAGKAAATKQAYCVLPPQVLEFS